MRFTFQLPNFMTQRIVYLRVNFSCLLAHSRKQHFTGYLIHVPFQLNVLVEHSNSNWLLYNSLDDFSTHDSNIFDIFRIDIMLSVQRGFIATHEWLKPGASFPQAIRCDHKKKKLFRNLVIHLLSVTCYPFVILVFCLAFKIQSDNYYFFLINQANCIWIASQLEVYIFVIWQTATLI